MLYSLMLKQYFVCFLVVVILKNLLTMSIEHVYGWAWIEVCVQVMGGRPVNIKDWSELGRTYVCVAGSQKQANVIEASL